ncbi:cytochrome P450 [Xylariaceae sp. FL0662B]|nr:cytochrome P450 [Xylariaceae sp. FL0662B]
MLSMTLGSPGMVLAVVTLGILYWLGWCIYCLWLHPLAKYPGPKVAAISEVWFAWAWTSGNYPKILEAAHRRYGDVIRIAPNELSFATAQAHRDIYSYPSKTKKPFLKCGTFYNNGDVTNIFYERDPVEHGRMRKVLAPGFSGTSMKSHEHIIQQYVDMFVQKLSQLSSERHGLGVDMTEAIQWLAFDVMGELTFGESFNAVASGQTHFWITLLNDSAHAAILPSLVRRVPYLVLAVPFMLSISAIRNLKKHYAFTLETVRRRLRRHSPQQDLFAPMLAQGSNPTERELVSTAQALIIAGADTVSTAMTVALYYLCTSPEGMAKLKAEVRALDGEQLTSTGLAQLPYLNAVIEEAMRCFPPIAFGLPRVSPGETVDGLFVPEGVRVSVPHWVLCHDPRVWDEPYQFRPERWLEGGGDVAVQTSAQSAVFPFSTGPRSCLGIAQAYMEMRITLAKLIYSCDLQVAQDPGDWIQAAKMNMMWKKAPLMLNFSPRRQNLVN